MKLSREDMILYAVTDRRWLKGETLTSQVEKALKGGVTCLQLREKDLDYKNFLSEAFEIKEVCRKYNIPFIINDNVEVALKCGADGIHVGQNDMNAKELRKLVGDKMIIGVSARNVQMAEEAYANGADYIGCGAVFGTSTKNDAKIINKEILLDICSAVPIPVVAIGGITNENAIHLQGCGIAGIAVVSAVFAHADIETAARELHEISSRVVNEK